MAKRSGKAADVAEVHNARGFTKHEWAASDYDPAQFDTALAVGAGSPDSPAMEVLIAQLESHEGAAVCERIMAHPLAPKIKRGHSGPIARQLAHALGYARESTWFAAADAIASELVVDGAVDEPEPAEPAEADPGDDLVHMARCAQCPAGVRYRTLPSRTGFAVEERYGVEVDTAFGIGAHGHPICPYGHGEMSIADETMPVAEAMAQVAEKVNGAAVQRTLFETSKPFNFEGAWMDVASKSADVAELASIHRADADRAKASKKRLEDAESTLREMITMYDERRVQKAREDDQRAESANSDEAFVGRIVAAGIPFDVASFRALTAERRDEIGAWLLDAEAHPDERERWSAELPSGLAATDGVCLAAGEVPDDGLPAAEGEEFVEENAELVSQEATA